MANVAQTILSQLGGNKFVAMTGASRFVEGERSLYFSLPSSARARNKANRVRISLTATDEYDVSFFRVRGIECKPIENFRCTVGSLIPAFIARTGLQVTL